MPFPKWNHLDHLWGMDADTLVYSEVLKNMELVRNGALIEEEYEDDCEE